MNRTQRLTLLLLLLGIAAAPRPATSQDAGVRGFVDMNQVESWFDEEPKIEVNIRGALLNLVAEASRFEDPELAELLLGLQGIQVRGFDIRGADDDDVRQRASELGRTLEQQGWETVVRVRDDDEQVHMYLMATGDIIDGIVVLAVDDWDAEAVFVNIVGHIEPRQVGRIGRKFNIGALDEY